MEKTITALNERWWYRVLKVSYLFFFVISILIANGILISDGVRKIDKDKTLIYCNGGDKRILTAKQSGVYLDGDDFSKGFDYKKFYEGDGNKYNINDILEACYDAISQDIFITQRTYEIVGFKDSPKEYDENYLNEQVDSMEKGYKSDAQKASYLDYSTRLFDIKLVYSYGEFLFGFILTNVSILAFFEIVRRAFYYIALGAIKPKK